MRLIDADAAKDEYCEKWCSMDKNLCGQDDIGCSVMRFLASVSTVDPIKHLEENGYTVFKAFKKKSWLESKPCNDCQDDNYYCGGCERYYEWRERKIL